MGGGGFGGPGGGGPVAAVAGQRAGRSRWRRSGRFPQLQSGAAAWKPFSGWVETRRWHMRRSGRRAIRLALALYFEPVGLLEQLWTDGGRIAVYSRTDEAEHQTVCVHQPDRAEEPERVKAPMQCEDSDDCWSARAILRQSATNRRRRDKTGSPGDALRSGLTGTADCRQQSGECEHSYIADREGTAELLSGAEYRDNQSDGKQLPDDFECGQQQHCHQYAL